MYVSLEYQQLAVLSVFCIVQHLEEENINMSRLSKKACTDLARQPLPLTRVVK